MSRRYEDTAYRSTPWKSVLREIGKKVYWKFRVNMYWKKIDQENI